MVNVKENIVRFWGGKSWLRNVPKWEVYRLKTPVCSYLLVVKEINCYARTLLRRQSIKKPNLWNSEPMSASSTLAMVALRGGDFKLHSDTSSIMPCQLIVELHALEW